MITIIAAVARNGAIGKDGELPWHCPEDLQWFKEQTMGKAILMGRKTYESIGKRLQGRYSVVLTTQPLYVVPEDGYVAKTPLQALGAASLYKSDETMIIGGGELYEQYLPVADRLLITHFEHDVEGDTFFPEIDDRHWKGRKIKDGEQSSENLLYSFWEYTRHVNFNDPTVSNSKSG